MRKGVNKILAKQYYKFLVYDIYYLKLKKLKYFFVDN